MRFTNCTSADPVCSPSRAGLLTGRYPTRVGVPRVLFPQDPGGLNLDETTLANALKARQYKTMCIGKWHLGRPAPYLPTSRGFDEYFGIPYSNDMNPRVLMHNTEVIEKTANLETLTRRYTEQATKFIGDSAGSPFFLYMPHTFPHIPLAASPRFRGKSAEGLYGDVVEEVDWSVGEVLGALKQHGLERNTLVLFSSDNGPWYLGSPGKLRGRKNTTYEGGVREPFIARWSGRIPGGRTSDALVSLMDVFPTVAGLCGAARPAKPLDGIDIWPLLDGEPAVDRESAAAVLRQLGPAVRALDELEAAHRAAQHRGIHAGASGRAAQLSAAEAGTVQPGDRSGRELRRGSGESEGGGGDPGEDRRDDSGVSGAGAAGVRGRQGEKAGAGYAGGGVSARGEAVSAASAPGQAGRPTLQNYNCSHRFVIFYSNWRDYTG